MNNIFSNFVFSSLDSSDFKENSVREDLIMPMLKELGYSSQSENKIIRSKSVKHKFVQTGSGKHKLINGILSFHILFQCKRYKGSVGAKEIRDFRGAMVSRTDKGLFVTTGKFTRDAIKEATRDGAPTIDLVDGEKLTEKLKELRLGVDIVLVEKIVVDKKWFIGL